MKKFLPFFLILANSFQNKTFACYFYPYGEEIRFSFLKPENIGYNEYKPFNYSTSYFYGDNTIEIPIEQNKNFILWQKYTSNQVTIDEVFEAVNKLDSSKINQKSENKLIQFLYKNSDFEAINYLIFAKECEKYSTTENDAWEKGDVSATKSRSELINRAIDSAQKSTKEIIKLRYAFQAIKLASYNNDAQLVQKIYFSYFENRTSKNVLDYWAMYFRTLTEKNLVKRNYYASQVFANCPEKRVKIITYYLPEIPISVTLKLTKTNEEKSDLWFIEGSKKSNRAISYLEEIYKINPTSSNLSFMLLREMNKMEDWILTPQYSLFRPSLRDDYWENSSASRILNRVEMDRQYVKQMLNFVKNVNKATIENAPFWELSEAYLYFLTKEYAIALKSFDKLLSKSTKETQFYNQILLLKGLCLTANQKKGKAHIPDLVKDLVLKFFDSKKQSKYIFAIAKELEYLENTNDASLLYSKLNKEYENSVYWKTINNNKMMSSNGCHDDFIEDWYRYLDVNLSSKQTVELIKYVKNSKNNDLFSEWLFSDLKKETTKLYDLLGIKYIRENNLSLALEAFSNLPDSYNMNKYFNENPFISLKTATVFDQNFETENLTKVIVTKKLIEYLKKAENSSEKNQDYYYFLVANCYYNMTYFGNSWMMRRISWSAGYNLENNIVDKDEYRSCDLAKKYYQKALSKAKTDKFKAICYYMIGKCESNKEDGKYNYKDQFYQKKKENINYYADLKSNYPNYYDDLTSSCVLFEEFFKARR